MKEQERCDVPYMAIGNEELEGRPTAALADEGRDVTCRCGGSHPLQFGTSNGAKSDIMGFITCPKNGAMYLVSVGQRLLTGGEYSPKEVKDEDTV